MKGVIRHEKDVDKELLCGYDLQLKRVRKVIHRDNIILWCLWQFPPLASLQLFGCELQYWIENHQSDYESLTNLNEYKLFESNYKCQHHNGAK